MAHLALIQCISIERASQGLVMQAERVTGEVLSLSVTQMFNKPQPQSHILVI